ncbi:unnamed protein product [Meloidogyne enterolobii]|uniref:Uncharacterized protein n=1 Tax=Meloidogyne enterolobii TaxID=390850 RepID=A0ACB0Z5L0_MELEN
MWQFKFKSPARRNEAFLKKSFKSVLRTNGCLYIAKNLVKNKNNIIDVFQTLPEILQTFCNLFKFHPQLVAKQFSEYRFLFFNFLGPFWAENSGSEGRPPSIPQ